MNPEHSKNPPKTEVEPYDHKLVEAKWRQQWEETELYRTDLLQTQNKFYNLMMFPYPSSEGLHVGHVIPYGGGDTYGRYRRMKGDTVFEPMGFDAFGIHSENYALSIGEHPAVVMRRAVHNFRDNQLKKLGTMFDWSREVNTADPSYYRWTQWLFLQLFNAGLAERREGPVNWCPSCLTVLADEQVENGRCERCESVVDQKRLTQWWLAITRYAQALLDAIDDLDWSASTKEMQRNWIGRSSGASISFNLQGCERKQIEVFTTRPDTLYGATFLVVAADHPQLQEFVASEQWPKVERWLSNLPTDNTPDFSVGISLGSEGINPLTKKPMPLWAAPYVLSDYGTGAIMAVPAHDERDYAFAKAHQLPIIEVVFGGEVDQEAYTGEGNLINSGEFDGLDWQAAKEAIIDKLVEEGIGQRRVQFKLRDWLISRQRYWGPPIPIIYCPDCGPVGVPEEQLPVMLPEVEEFRPLGTGVSPLAAVEEWVNVECPKCGKAAKRETDVSDTFLDSAWYFLRYPSSDIDDQPFDIQLTSDWLPVDMYIGGNEHAVRHLLYARFIMRVLYDLGLVPAPEPFKKFRAHGMIIKDGAKMSKSRGNVLNPDDYVGAYGADTFRLALLFSGPYTVGGDFRDDGIKGIQRFVERIWRATQLANIADGGNDVKERRRHRLIARVDEDIAELNYNTAIAFLMEFARELDQEVARGEGRVIDSITLLQLMAPFAPYFTEELWHRLGQTGSIHNSAWPEHDPRLAAALRVRVAVQINGKLRDTIDVAAGTSAEELEAQALALPKIVQSLKGTPKKVIVVADRVVNIVV